MRTFLRRRTIGKSTINFTLISNCIGGRVNVDNIYRGTIPSSGKLDISFKGNGQRFFVIIAGGTPGTSIDSQISSAGLFEFFYQNGGSVTKSLTSTIARTTYTAPAGQYVTKGSTITMNYTKQTQAAQAAPLTATKNQGGDWFELSDITGNNPYNITITVKPSTEKKISGVTFSNGYSSEYLGIYINNF